MHLDEDVIMPGDHPVQTVWGRLLLLLSMKVPGRRVNQFLKYCYFNEEDMMLKRPYSRLTIAFSLLTVLMLFFSACGAQGTPTTTTSTKPVKGGTWIEDL